MGYLDDILSGKPVVQTTSRPTTPGTVISTPNIPVKRPNVPIPSTQAAKTPIEVNSLKRKATADLTQDVVKPVLAAVPRPQIIPVKPGPKIPVNTSNGSKHLVKKAPGPAATKPVLPAATAVARAPAKGSFAEIMARGKNLATSKLAVDFRIVNKKTEKQPKELLKDVKNKSLAKKDMVKKDKGSTKLSKDRISEKAVKEEKSVRKPLESTYKGTSRTPLPLPTYKGTAALRADSSRSQNAGAVSRTPAHPDKRRHDRYDSYDDEEEEEEDDEEEEDGYGSDGSSDMEAGIMDIEEEEELALRAARREDAIAHKEEEEHRRLKLARKMGR